MPIAGDGADFHAINRCRYRGGHNLVADFYTGGMHPWVFLPLPGLCPIGLMDLTPIDPDKCTGAITLVWDGNTMTFRNHSKLSDNGSSTPAQAHGGVSQQGVFDEVGSG